MCNIVINLVNAIASNLRKFCRLLKENEIFHNMSSVVALSEVPGKGHWFDGVVDDDQLQPFIDEYLNAKRKPVLPDSFTVMTMNPATSGSRGGLRILSLEVIFELARLRVERIKFPIGGWRIQTQNVRRFRYEPIDGIDEQPTRLHIDGDENGIAIPSSVLDGRNDYVDFCAASQTDWAVDTIARSYTDLRLVTWRQCDDTRIFGKAKSKERGPDNFGPGFRVLGQRKVVIVYPEGDAILQDFAVRYSNSLYIRGISASVTTDSNVTAGQLGSSGDVNMVLLGGPGINRIAKMQIDAGYSADVSFNKEGFCIAQRRCFAEGGTGIAFMSSGPRRTLLFYTSGTDRDGVLAAMDWLPYSPASNVPEWVIMKKSYGWGFRGLGGVVALGYWDYEWKLEPRKSYPSEFVFDSKVPGVTCAAAGIRRAQMHMWATSIFGVIIVGIMVLAWIKWRRRRLVYSAVPKDENGVSLLAKDVIVDVIDVEHEELLQSNDRQL